MTIKELEEKIAFCTKGWTDEEKAATQAVIEWPDTKELVLDGIESDKNGLYLLLQYA